MVALFSLGVKVSSGGAEAEASLQLSVTPANLPLAIVDQELPVAEFGRSYTARLVAVGGKPPYVWTLKPDTRLPIGLALASDGRIEGRASEAVGHLDLAAGVLDRAAAAPAAFLALARHYTGARAFDRVGFWMYSVGVASAAEILAAGNRKLRVRPEEAFVAGLVHGLGKPILDLLLPRAYGRVLEVAEHRRSDSAPVERDVFGIDHHAAGKTLNAGD